MLAVPTTCPFCACGCGFYLLVENGQPVGVAPSETHPVSHGRLCARAWHAHQAVLWGERLRHPLIRRNGNLEPASWTSALNHLTHRLKDLIDSGKPVGVLGSARATNEENYLAGKLARAGLRTNNIDFSYRAVCRSLIQGIEDVTGAFIPSITLQEVESSETILLIEGDLAETHPQAASSIMRALEQGARLVTIGCRRTQMVRLSSLHLEAVPGDEGYVINGLLAALIRPERGDRRVATADTEEYASLIHNLETSEVTEELRRAAEWIARAEWAVPMPGLRDQCRGTAAAVATLAAITRHLHRPGSGILPLLARSNARGACEMGIAPDRLPGYEPLACGPTQDRLQNLWDRSLPASGGTDVETLLESVSGLIVLADDPPSILPGARRATAALQKIEFLAVLDVFATPTTEMAEVALPIASFAETEGTLG